MTSDKVKFFADPLTDDRVVPISESGCWIWTGWADHHGYGFVTRKQNGKKTHMRVHRLHLEAKLGRSLTASENACHRCDIPDCVNPDHLFVGTHVENMRDMVAKKRAARGERHGMSKLTAETVAQIYLATGLHKDIGAAFGVGRECVDKIKRGDRWLEITKHLAPANPTPGGSGLPSAHSGKTTKEHDNERFYQL